MLDYIKKLIGLADFPPAVIPNPDEVLFTGAPARILPLGPPNIHDDNTTRRQREAIRLQHEHMRRQYELREEQEAYNARIAVAQAEQQGVNSRHQEMLMDSAARSSLRGLSGGLSGYLVDDYRERDDLENKVRDILKTVPNSLISADISKTPDYLLKAIIHLSEKSSEDKLIEDLRRIVE